MLSAPAPYRLLTRIQAALGLAIVLGLPFLQASPASAATLDKIRQASKLTLGYREDARPFSFKDESGDPTGYSITLCRQVADEVKAELGGGDLTAWSTLKDWGSPK